MSHGGNIRKLRERAGGREIIDFSASINPLGPPPWLRRVIARNLSGLAHYPDVDNTELIVAAAKAFAVPPDTVIPCNGTSEALFALPRLAVAHNIKRALIPAPSYIDYAVACARAQLTVEHYTLSAEAQFDFPTPAELAQKANATPGGALIFLGMPNNPTGSTVTPVYLQELAARCPDSWIIADAAYQDFQHEGAEPTGDRAWLAGLARNVIVLWSLTKFYGMAGLRLGVAFASGELARALREELPPWSVNTLAQVVGTRALEDSAYYEASRKEAARLYAFFFAGLQSIPGLTAFPSRSNFLLCRVDAPGQSGATLAEALLQRGLAVRTCADFAGLGVNWLRFAMRPEEEANLLMAALRELLSTPGAAAATPHTQKKRPPALMLCGTSSDAGKSVLTAALCRIMRQDGYDVCPFKAQNMALNSGVTRDGGEMGRAQVMQAQAARLEPDTRMNPVLLKPNSDTGSQVIVRGKPVGNMRVMEYVRYKEEAFRAVREAYDELSAEHEVMLLEGAGSPAEVNLKKHDIVNLRMAAHARAPVLLVGDIDRGGVYASFIGTYETCEEWERQLIQGFLVNRFRGDAGLLKDAHDYVLDFTGRPVLGVVPYLKDLGLPQEDSVAFRASFIPSGEKWEQTLDLALIALPHISNYTDFDALAAEPDVCLRIVSSAEEFGRPDAVLLPGSKNVPGDLRFLHRFGLARLIADHAAAGRAIAGICGGLQILGQAITDPHQLEGGGTETGLGLLRITTVLEKEKQLRRSRARLRTPNAPELQVSGYEIHHGESDTRAEQTFFVRDDGAAVGCGDLRIWGTYLHGVYDDDAFRRWYLDTLRTGKGWEPVGKIVARYDLEPAFDRLADAVRAGIDMPAIYRLLGLR